MMAQSHATSLATRSIHQGLLQKRCRLSWRPRHVEVISDPSDMTGHNYSFQLLIYDPRKRMLKDRIRMESIVTIRASRDCYFQIFLSNGKIVQFKTETIESQAHWIAMLKMGLGRGSIFHVFLNSVSDMHMEHALLYSVGVNLPPHRVGQVDRVLVLASPINDINLHAWDLNRVKRFVELDIGIRMELCAACVRGQNSSLTFVIEKQFVKDCMNFLRKEARIAEPPVDDHGLLIHTVPHQCFFNTPPSKTPPPPPPPYSPKPPPAHKQLDANVQNSDMSTRRVRFHTLATHTGPTDVDVRTHSKSECPHPRGSSNGQPSNDGWFPLEHSYSSGSESRTRESLGTQDDTLTKRGDVDFRAYLPPRTIARPNYDSAIPAQAYPYLNYQPHLYSHSGNRHFEPPYQISSRIIITDSGEVQFERNVTGTMPTNSERKFHFIKEMPVPPRGLGMETNSSVLEGSTYANITMRANCQFPVYPGEDLQNSASLSATLERLPKTKKLSTQSLFENREYVNFPVSTTPPPTAKYASRHTHVLCRTSSDSELNYTSNPRRVYSGKRASQVSDTSDIYIIPLSPRPRSPLPTYTPSILDQSDSEPQALNTEEKSSMGLGNPSPEHQQAETDQDLCSNVLGNGIPDRYCELQDSSTFRFTSTAPKICPIEPPDLHWWRDTSPSLPATNSDNDSEKMQSPTPLPRKTFRPIAPPRKMTLQKSEFSGRAPNTSSKQNNSNPEQQKRPVPRPRTKTSLQVSLNLSLSASDENLLCHKEKQEKNNSGTLQSKSCTSIDQFGVGVTDV